MPDAIFASSDLAAIGVMNEAVKRNIRVPEDVQVMGYDDITLASTETMALSTIRQSARDLAKSGVDALVHRLKNPEAPIQKSLVPPTEVVRKSTS
jgi:LacI family transcriptional regulator